MKLSKNAVGLAVAASIGAFGFSGQANAIIEGAAGEALLVPFAVFDSENFINTLVEITVPGSVGLDTIPNFFTAPNTTPTAIKDPAIGSSLALEIDDPDLGARPKDGDTNKYEAAIHVYAFDEKSQEVWNDSFPVSPDDFMLLNWGDIVVKNAPFLDGQKVYLVVTNEKTNNWNGAAKFSMFGDAFMMFPIVLGVIDTKIPVLPMSDGNDATVTARCTPGIPCIGNEVVHQPGKAIKAVSPLSAGMRIGKSDGDLNEYTLFDLTMSNRFLPTLHVIWMDQNIGQVNPALVFNDVEQDCSTTLPINNELQVYWTSLPFYFQPITYATCVANCNLSEAEKVYVTRTDPNGLVPDWVDASLELCYPDGIFTPPVNPLADTTPIDGDFFFPGFVRFQVNEYQDRDTGWPEAAGVAFSIQMQVDILTNDREEIVGVPQILPIETALGHERGTFEQLF